MNVKANAVIEGNDVTLQGTAGDIALSTEIGESAGPAVGGAVAAALQDILRSAGTVNLPLSVIFKQGTADVTVGQAASITAAGNVVVDANATANATGDSLWTYNGTFGASLTFTDANSDAEATIDQGAQITAGGNVAITSEASSTASGTSKSEQAVQSAEPLGAP